MNPRPLLGFVLTAAITLCWALPALPCDGIPPELTSKDTVDHPYELVCGRKTEQGTLPAGATQSLEGKSGCELKLGDNPPTKLHTEMVCTVEAGKLTCDLI